MITFKPVIRNVRSDGYAAVYIRVTKDRQADYIKTVYIAKKSQLNGKDLKDYALISKVSVTIEKFVSRLNNEDTELWTLQETVNFLMQENNKISFTDYFNEFTSKMRRDGRIEPSANYQSAYNSLFKFSGKKQLFFSDITSKLINEWIESLKHTSTAKNHYPTLINAVFTAGTKHFNDYERGILRIKNQPFMHVEIPDCDVADKKAIEKDILLKIFNADCMTNETAIFAKDIALLTFALVGINGKDLFIMEQNNFKNGKLCYNRSKTKTERQDKAYIEILVPEMILPLFKKYKGTDGKLFDFCNRYKNRNYFNRAINLGLDTICKDLKIEKVTSYTFRHSWATIAQNNCGASIEQVAFALNHSTEYRITKGYIKTDFSPIDKLNKKVLKFVFGNK